jgi:pyrimidine-specific ribonucleoside hydrolase
MHTTGIWIDTDLSVGMKRHNRPGYCDVDDGYAIWQLMQAPEATLVGMSTVFGNSSLDHAYALSQHMSEAFAQAKLPVYRGAAAALDLRDIQTNPAVEALAEALRQQPLRIMAIGPATNVGLLLLRYPALASQIEEVVLVAGRRSAEAHFHIGTQGRKAADANFDKDVDAFRVLFEAGIRVVLCPFEISNQVWLGSADLDRLAQGGPAQQWLADQSRIWLQQWLDQGETGFNPFDVLASHYLIAPEDLLSEPLQAHLEIHPNDTDPNAGRRVFKPYLVCDQSPGFPVTYCYGVVPGYHERLMTSLLGGE